MPLIEQYNNELYHYGVKGMKWGIRKSRAEIQADRLARYKNLKFPALNVVGVENPNRKIVRLIAA